MSTEKVSGSDFFRRLDELRKLHGESLTDVAAVCGVSAPAVHGWRKGGMPKLDKLRLLADHYRCDVGYFLGHPGIRTVPADEPGVVVSGSNSVVPVSSPSPVAESPPCPGCRTRDGEIAYLRGVVADQAAALRAVTAGVCRHPQGAEGPTAGGGALQKTG